MFKNLRIEALSLVLSWLIYLGVVGPYLISAPNTLLVLLGMLLAVLLLWWMASVVQRFGDIWLDPKARTQSTEMKEKQ